MTRSKSDPVSAGVIAAALTPLDADLKPDCRALVAHCQWLLNEGCHGLGILGTTGEANSFTVDERLQILDAVVEGGIPGSALIPGTGACALGDVVRLTRRAIEHGMAGVLVLPPFYYKPVSVDGLFAAYSEIIQRIGSRSMALYLYHIPQNTGVPITHRLVERLLAAYPDVVKGLKDSSDDWSNMQSLCRTFPGFRVFSGSDLYLLDLLRVGGAGCITACNNIAGRLAAEVYRARQSPQADSLQMRLSAVRKAVQKFPLVEALKEVTARRTGQPGWRRVRSPLRALDQADAQYLMAELSSAGFPPTTPPVPV